MVTVIAGVVGLGVLALLGVVAAQPAAFEIRSERAVAASPEVVFAQLVDFRRWTAWSPWQALDANTEHVYEGESGVGHSNAWQSAVTGAGKQVITACDAPRQLEIDLTFIKPFEAHNLVFFEVAPTATGSRVVWRMTGVNNFAGKAFFLFGGKKSVGADFDKGLASLAEVAARAEQAARPPTA